MGGATGLVCIRCGRCDWPHVCAPVPGFVNLTWVAHEEQGRPLFEPLDLDSPGGGY